jgi:Fic family protein
MILTSIDKKKAHKSFKFAIEVLEKSKRPFNFDANTAKILGCDNATARNALEKIENIDLSIAVMQALYLDMYGEKL